MIVFWETPRERGFVLKPLGPSQHYRIGVLSGTLDWAPIMPRVASLSRSANAIFSGRKSARHPSGCRGDDSVRVLRKAVRGVRVPAPPGGGGPLLHHVRPDICRGPGLAAGRGPELFAEHVRVGLSYLHGPCHTKGWF